MVSASTLLIVQWIGIALFTGISIIGCSKSESHLVDDSEIGDRDSAADGDTDADADTDADTFTESEAQVVYYVSPTGSNDNLGTKAEPFLTITKARDTVRTVNSNTLAFLFRL